MIDTIKVTVDGEPVTRDVTMEQVRAYLRTKGWEKRAETCVDDSGYSLRGRVELWHPIGSSGETFVCVWATPMYGSSFGRGDERRLRELITEIASLEKRHPATVLREIAGDPISAPMSLDRAKEITSACVAHCAWHMVAREGEAQPQLPECSLEEMLVANRMVGENAIERTENPDGSTTTQLRVRCDPRIIAAFYALKQYGGSPANLLQAVGYKFKVREDKSTKRRRAANGGAR